MDIDISDDLQYLRDLLEANGCYWGADTVSRAALEIARLRGGDDPAFKPTLTAHEKEALIVASIELNTREMYEDSTSYTLRKILARMS